MLKSALRREIRELCRRQSAEQLQAWSREITMRLSRHERVRSAHTILAYYSLPDEADTHQWVEQLYQEGKTVLLPKVIDDKCMELRTYTGIESLEEGAFGISEPTGPRFTTYRQIDTAIIPGVAFDRCGHRLGRGKGYYDRLLPLIKETYKIGVCFPYQLTAGVPTEAHDIAVDEVICPPVGNDSMTTNKI